MSDNPADDFEDGISAVRDADLGGDAVTGNEIAEPQQTTSGKTKKYDKGDQLCF